VALPLWTFDFLLPMMKEASSQPGFRGGWYVWSLTLRAVRRLLRDPTDHQRIDRPKLVTAIYLVGVFRWAPPIARQICPGRMPDLAEIVKAYAPSKGSAPGIYNAIDFWAGLDDYGADDLFIRDGDEEIVPVNTWPELTCERCGLLNGRTQKGRLPRRALCGRCKKAKENAAWKEKDRERAKRLWRAATRDARQRKKTEGE
jgi:hypothetical protein